MGNIPLYNVWMKQMFDSIPRKYNPLNKIITFGQDETWRQKALEAIEAKPGDRILDICTGTGNLALKISCKFPYAEIYAVDFSNKMLEVAKERAAHLGLQNITFKENDCSAMEFPENYFDYITISFGFRNLSHSMMNLDRALKEIYRVLKNGGRLIIIETTQPNNIIIRKLFHFYVCILVPLLGIFLSGKRKPYTYLGTSIVKFFDRNKLTDILSSIGFQMEKAKTFMLGMILLSTFKKRENT